MVRVRVGVGVEVEVEVVVVVEVEVVVEVVVGQMTKMEFEKLQSDGFSPLPGRCVILLDPPPATIGHIVIPDSAKVHVVKASGYTGVVLAVEEGWTYVKRSMERFGHTIWVSDLVSGEEAVHAFKVGDRVVLGLHMDELTEEVVWARNGQVEAVIT